MASTTATTTTTLATSNLRGASRQTRNNPTRTSRNSRPNLQQNSLVSNPPAVTQGDSEPHGFYPAISHFTDAIAALPRDYRRHVSLLKEVDAKAWLPEENLQNLLGRCLTERRTRPVVSTAQTVAGSSSNAADDAAVLSTTNSVNGTLFDNASQYSSQSVDPAIIQRRQLYQSLRMNLMQMMVTMDEKNHVINNANEDLSRHVRRLDDVWPHISEELSDDARLGSLKHWAFTDLNPPKKVVAASARREAASSLAIMVDTDIAHRSESRREAMLAKKQRLNQHADSDFDEKAIGRKGIIGKGKKPELAVEAPLPAAVGGASKRKKPEKTIGGIGMERSASGLRTGATAMSREPSQQDNTKKRKAPTSAGMVARKRLNANQQESPKLVSSPLANSTGRDAVKRSPALSNARPVGRGRQNSGHGVEGSKNRPSSSASYRNTTGMDITAEPAEIRSVAAATGKSISDVRNTMKESTNSKGDKLLEISHAANGDTAMRGGILLERTTSSRGAKKEHLSGDTKAGPLPRSIPAPLSNEVKFSSRGRASKTSTPVIGTFAEADGDDSGGANGSENGIGGSANNKPKRPPRPRIKDHHGLQDSLSPKGLPIKRTHAKNLSLSSFTTAQINSSNNNTTNNNNSNNNNSRPASSRARGADRDDEINIRSTSRNHAPSASQSTVSNNNKTADEEADDDDLANEEEDELRYCYCNGISYGEMVACDNKNCPREWFHLECIGLKSLPKSAKWYCDECKENLARRGRFGSTSNGNGVGNGEK